MVPPQLLDGDLAQAAGVLLGEADGSGGEGLLHLVLEILPGPRRGGRLGAVAPALEVRRVVVARVLAENGVGVGLDGVLEAPDQALGERRRLRGQGGLGEAHVARRLLQHREGGSDRLGQQVAGVVPPHAAGDAAGQSTFGGTPSLKGSKVPRVDWLWG